MKIFNRRVKGSEKFWSEAGAEAILQLRAAFLSEDGRLDRHLKERPSSPFRTYKARKIGKPRNSSEKRTASCTHR